MHEASHRRTIGRRRTRCLYWRLAMGDCLQIRLRGRAGRSGCTRPRFASLSASPLGNNLRVPAIRLYQGTWIPFCQCFAKDELAVGVRSACDTNGAFGWPQSPLSLPHRWRMNGAAPVRLVRACGCDGSAAASRPGRMPAVPNSMKSGATGDNLPSNDLAKILDRVSGEGSCETRRLARADQLGSLQTCTFDI